jgi:hypothetical protein
MSFRRCQHDDPFTQQVRRLYAANVVRAPRAGLEPLDVLAVRKRQVEPRGRLEGFLANDVQLPTPRSDAAADMDGVRSTKVDLELGLTLTATFLHALGVPMPGARLDAAMWKGSRSLQFEVKDVEQHQVDLGQLGKVLTGATIDRDSPAAGVFFRDVDVSMFIITRTLTSTQFSVRNSSESQNSAAVSVDAIADVIGKAHANVQVSRQSADSVHFTGTTPVTFAFAAVPCVMQSDGRFLFGLEANQLTLGTDPSPEPQSQPLFDEDGLLDFDTVVD